jgi:Cft2 family RNA processing exonuclease
VKFTDLNPHGGIGANCTYCQIGPFRFALDSGLHPKHAGNDSVPRHDQIDPDGLDFILLTHCHLDHLGSLPLLSRKNPTGTRFLKLSKFHPCPSHAFQLPRGNETTAQRTQFTRTPTLWTC